MSDQKENSPRDRRALELYASGLSLVKVAAEVGSSQSTVRLRLLEAGVKLRSAAGIQKRRRKVSTKEVVLLYREGLTAQQVADRLKVSKRTALLRLREAGEVRKHDRSWVPKAVELYESGLTTLEVADRLDKPLGTIGRVIWAAGVGRSGAASREYPSGDGNPNWQGGSSFLPYPPEFNKALKLLIRERDGFACQLCGIDEDAHRAKYRGPNGSTNGQALSIHHVDYDKTNCDERNLITLCLACNPKVNADRDQWTEYFMKERACA